MKEYTVGCDMGNMKVHFEGYGSIFFSNHVGDGFFDVAIYEKGEIDKDEFPFRDMEFLGHFTVFENAKATLQQYDCEVTSPLHEFEAGRWFVHYDKSEAKWYVSHKDMELHA